MASTESVVKEVALDWLVGLGYNVANGPVLIETERAGDNGRVVLAALQDALLPKLISGELRVLDAERIVGRVV